MRSFYILLCTLLYIYSCTSTTSDQTTTDISKIDIVENSLDLEIMDSDELLFGNLSHLLILDDGSLLVSDRSPDRLDHFDEEGNHLYTVATAGNGPGELPTRFTFSYTQSDTLIVKQAGRTSKLDLFVRNESSNRYEYHKSINVQGDHRNYRFIAPHPTNGFYSRFETQFLSFQSLAENGNKEYSTYQIAHVNSFEEIIRDSLYDIKFAMQIIEIGENNSSISITNPPPYRYEDRFRIIPGTTDYLIARIDEHKIDIYDQSNSVKKSIALNFLARPIQDTDLDFIFDKITTGRKIKEPMISDYKPSFLNVWVSESYIWLQTDISEKGKELVILDMGGNVLGKTYVPYHDSIRHITDDKVYALNKDPEATNTIRVYAIGL